jgi:hypothetical protein
MLTKRIFSVVTLLVAVPVAACTPPGPREDSGFVRSKVDHLPKNARGVMFYLAGRQPKVTDVEVTSSQDKRKLTLRINRMNEDDAWVRLEPVQGFLPGARYRFRFVGKHAAWSNPDEMSVTIDNEDVSTVGDYAITLASRPAHKVIVVPTSSGSCVEPVTAVVQEFTYATPASLQRYRDILTYDAQLLPLPGAPKITSYALEWPLPVPTLYDNGNYSLGRGFSQRYNRRNNAIVAACGPEQGRIKLVGLVGLPEVDLHAHRTPVVELDLNSNVEGRCDALDALVHSVDWRTPEPSLRELCQGSLARSFRDFDGPLRAVEFEAWERALSFSYAMSPTCNLVALGYLWHTGQYDARPETLHLLGTALETGMRRAERAQHDAAVHALVYVIEQFPLAKRRAMAEQLLRPVQPVLVDALAEPSPLRPDELAHLIDLGGPLTPALRRKVELIANGKTATRAQARRLLGIAG